MADQDQKPANSEEQQNDFQPPPFALKEPPALKSMASAQSAPPPFSFRTPITPQVISGSPKPASSLPGYQQSSLPLQPLQPLQPTQPLQPLQPMQGLQPLQPQTQPFVQMQPVQPSSGQQSMPFNPFPQAQQGFPPQSQASGSVGYFPQQPQQPQQPMFPQQPPQPQSQNYQNSGDDQSQQILAKLQQFMNQMNSFMKSVDARLTTLEKMVQQVAVVQNQQLELAKASQQHVPQPHQQQPVPHPNVSAHPPPDFSRAISDFPEPQHYPHSSPPPYLPDPYQPDYRAPTNYFSKSRQEIDDEELARRLQQEFNFEAQKIDTKKMASSPSSNNSAGTDECPVCKLTLPVRELEVHVQTHFPEFYENMKKPVPTDKPQEEKSFWDRLFGSDDEKPAPPPPQPTLYPSFYNSPPPGYSYINPN